MTGSLQLKRGKLYAVLNLKDKNGQRRQKWILFPKPPKGNKREAEKFLREQIKTYEALENLVDSDWLFEDYVLNWLETIAKLKLDENTYASYARVTHTYIIPYFKPKKIMLKDVKREDIQKYVNYMHDNGRIKGDGGLSAKSIKHHIVVMKQALTEAVKNNILLTNPCDYITMPKIKKYEASFYTAEQIEDLLEASKNDDLYYLIYITVVLGLRRSEVLGLKWDSVDMVNKTVTIKHTVVSGEFSRPIAKDSTKNKSSYRSFPVGDDIIEVFNILKEQEKRNKKLMKNEYIENDYIFKDAKGKPFRPDYVTGHFSRILKKNNLPKIRFHDLRHSCASLLISKGFTLKDIQEWLGHSDIQTTANIYSHLDTERKTKIMSSMTNSFAV